MSEKHGERFHHDIKSIETRYQGRWDVSMIADCCLCLKRDCKNSEVAGKVKRENSCLIPTSKKPDLVRTKLY